MYLIMFVLDDPDRLDAVLDAWDEIGVHGATIIESTGIQRRRRQRTRLPMRYAFEAVVAGRETSHYTLFVIVPDADLIQKCLSAAESVVGDLDAPNTGVMAAWPLTAVKGVPLKSDGEDTAE